MHLRITAVLCCAVLVGFAAASQVNNTILMSHEPLNRHVKNADKSYYAEIDIDDDLEGSGGGTEVSHDLESSGSGYGPDDEDSTDPHREDSRHIPEPTIIPSVIDPDQSKPSKEEDLSEGGSSGTRGDSSVIMNPKPEDRPTSFFAQPGILAAVIGGAVVGLLCAILVVMFIVYRMRKKDEGSYPLDEPKRSPTSNSYNRGNSKEFYA